MRSKEAEKMSIKIVRSAEAEWKPSLQRGSFSQRRKALGGERVQCGLWELAPGKKSFPFHLHHATEEALFVVSGQAKVRSSEGEHAIGPGDFVSFPVGAAHQLINDATEPFVYLGISAYSGQDVVEYPDSGKVAAMVGLPPNAKRWIFRGKDQVDYFDGEE
jgi:uncharacterized cupin superfamily protein